MKLLIAKQDFSVRQSSYFWNFVRPKLATDRGSYQVGADEVYVAPDDVAHTHRKMFNEAKLDMKDVYIPPDWDIKAALASPKKRISVMIMHGTGSGYGDILSGVYAVDRLKARFAKEGKRLHVAALCREIAMDHYYDICRIRDSFDEIFPFAVKLGDLAAFDYMINTETLLGEKAFNEMNFYDYWIHKFGMNPDEEDKKAFIAPSPKVLSFVKEQCEKARADLGPGDPLCMFNVHATRLRCFPMRIRTKFAEVLAKKYRLVLASAASDRDDLQRWIATLSPELKSRIIDMSELSSRGWDYLAGLLIHMADVVVTPDTGVLHLAGLLRRPTVAVFFTIEPDLRTRYMPTVRSYVQPEWRDGPFWGLSKARGKQQSAINEETNRRDMDEDYIAAWDAFQPEKVLDLCGEVMGLQKMPPIISGYKKHKHPRVAVYGYETTTSYFDDRLPLMLIPQILPGDAEVDWFPWRPYKYIPLSKYDLVIFGSGGGVIGSVLDQPGLVELVRAAKHSIGIFGIELREHVDMGRLRDLIGSLDKWYARTANDIEFAGVPGRHFGIWQMALWPLTDWRYDETLTVMDQAKKAHETDHAMYDIPMARRCVSHHLGPYLCALSGCESVMYVEQFYGEGKTPTGAFKSVTEEIFGKPWVGEKWYDVNREKVAQYKEFVRQSIELLRAEVVKMLED